MRLQKVLVWSAASLAAAMVVAGAALAGGQHTAAVTTIKAVQGPPKFEINRFVQDALRWNKDVYTVKLWWDPPYRQSCGRRRPAHVYGSGEEGRTADSGDAVPVQDLREARQGAWRRPEQRRAAEVPVPRERRRPEDAAARRPPRRLRRHRQGEEGRVDRPEGDGSGRDEAPLHLPDPPVDAGGGRRHLRLPSVGRRRGEVAGGRRRPRPRRPRHLRSVVRQRSVGRQRLERAHDRLLGRRCARRLEHRAERPRRDHGDMPDAITTLPTSRPSRPSSTAATRALADAASERAARDRRRAR